MNFDKGSRARKKRLVGYELRTCVLGSGFQPRSARRYGRRGLRENSWRLKFYFMLKTCSSDFSEGIELRFVSSACHTCFAKVPVRLDGSFASNRHFHSGSSIVRLHVSGCATSELGNPRGLELVATKIWLRGILRFKHPVSVKRVASGTHGPRTVEITQLGLLQMFAVVRTVF